MSERLPWTRSWTALAVVVLVLVAKGLGFLREAVVASLLGVSSASDSYYVAFAVPTVLYNLAALPYALWVTARLATPNGANDEGSRLYHFALGVVVAGGLLVIAVCLLFAHPLIAIMVPGARGSTDFHHMISVARIGVLATPAFGLQAIANAKLFATGRFKVAYGWVAVGGLVGLATVVTYTPVYGAPGAVGSFVLAAWTAAAGAVWSAGRTAAQGGQSVPAPAEGFGVGVVGRAVVLQLFLQAGLLLIYVFGSWLPPGQLAASLFASKIQVAVYETIIVTAGVLVYPRIARALHGRENERAWRTVTWALGWLLPGAAVLAIVLVVFRTELVTLVYRRSAFDGNAAALVSSALLGLAPGLVGLTLVEIVHRALVLRGRMWWYITALGTALLLNWIFCRAFVPRLGVLAVTLGSSIGAVVAGLGLLGGAASSMPVSRRRQVVLLCARTAAAALATFLVVGFLHARIAGYQSPPLQLVVVGSGTALALVLFTGVVGVLGHRWPVDESDAEEGRHA